MKILKYKVISLSLIACALSFACFNATCFASNNICKRFVQEKSLNKNFVYVNLAKDKDNVIALLVLGYPKFLNVSVNGIDVKNTQIGTDDVICNGHLAGEIRYYDMHKVNVDAGVFEVSTSNNVKASLSFFRN